jgi:hypothetical protein
MSALPLLVGSRTGAPILGSGGCSIAFAVARSPAAIITFPAPAASNVACDFLALRSPVCFRGRSLLDVSDQEGFPQIKSSCVLHHSQPKRRRLRVTPVSHQRSSAFAAAHILCFWSCKSPGAFIRTPSPPILSVPSVSRCEFATPSENRSPPKSYPPGSARTRSCTHFGGRTHRFQAATPTDACGGQWMHEMLVFYGIW